MLLIIISIALLQVVQQWLPRDGRSDGREGGGAAMAMVAQQGQWQCSDGNGGAATA
jgi:hypothetical protein